MISVEHLTRKYGDFVAVNDLSFAVDDGALFALLGSNGAGKTTTISCMTTLLAPTSGQIIIDGHQVGREDLAVKNSIGVVFQQSLLDPILTVRENLALRAAIYKSKRKRIDELADLVGLREFIDRRYGVLSGGEKRRADIARALFHKPTTLFLDEPTTGLDPASREQVWKAIADLRQTLGLTVLLTTHYMPETEAADYVLIMDHGRELAGGTPVALRGAYSKPVLTLELAGLHWGVIRACLDIYAPEAPYRKEGGGLRVELEDYRQAQSIIASLGEKLTDFQFERGNMDDVFLRLVDVGESA